jgi:hypothetical protein
MAYPVDIAYHELQQFPGSGFSHPYEASLHPTRETRQIKQPPGLPAMEMAAGLRSLICFIFPHSGRRGIRIVSIDIKHRGKWTWFRSIAEHLLDGGKVLSQV